MKHKFKILVFALFMCFFGLNNVNAAWTGNATGTGTNSVQNNGKPCDGCYGYCYSPCNNAWFSLVRLTLVYYDGSNYNKIGSSIYVGDYAGTDPKKSTWKDVYAGIGDVYHWDKLKKWDSTETGFAEHLKKSVIDDVGTLLGWMGTSSTAISNGIKNGSYPKHKPASGSVNDTGVRIIAELLVGYSRVCGTCGSYRVNVGTIKGLAEQGNMGVSNFQKLANYLRLVHDDIGFYAPSSDEPSFADAKADSAGWGIGIFSPFDTVPPGEGKCNPGNTEATIKACCKEHDITDTNQKNNTTEKLTRKLTQAELENYCSTRCNPGTSADSIKNCCTTIGITNLDQTKNTTQYLTKTISKENLQKYCSNRCNPGNTKNSIQECCKQYGITEGNQSKNTLDYLTRTLTSTELKQYCPNKCDPDKEGVVTCCKLFGITPTNQANNTTMYLTRILTNYELTNTECNPEYLNCQYSLEQDMQGDCNVKTKGYITDENNEWKCVFYSTKASYSEVKNNFKMTGNDYCSIYCTEKVEYDLPKNSTKAHAGEYMVVKNSTLNPAIWPVKYSARKTCRTTKKDHSTEGIINVKQFEDDMAANENAIKAAWDNYRSLYAQQEACNNATYSGSGKHVEYCAEYETRYYTYEGVQYSYQTCVRYEYRDHDNYSNGKAYYDGQTFTCSYTKSSCGCYKKPDYSSQIQSALNNYNNLINKRNNMLSQLNQCNNFNVSFEFEPVVAITYEEPIYGSTFTLVNTKTDYSSYKRFYTSGNASEGSGSYQGSAPQKKLQIRNCTWDNCKSTKEQSYPSTTWIEARKSVNKEYELGNNVFRYIAKYSGRSFHTAAEAGDNYTYMDVSNLPVHYSTYPGKYNFRIITSTYGSGNKFTKYVFNGNTFAGKSYKKDGIYNCQYEVPCDRFLVKKDCAEFKARCGKQYQESGCSAELIYRTISLDTDTSSGNSLAFLNQSGDFRAPGQNWGSGRVRQFIQNNRNVAGYEVYKQSPMYEVTLTVSLMKEIRKYNKEMNNRKVTVYEGTSKPTTGVAGYTSQDGLKCTDNGGHCTSKKIREWGVKGCAIKGATGGYTKCSGVTAW